MDGDSLSGLITVLALIAAHAGLTLSYSAIVNTRATWLREQEDNGNRRAGEVLKLTTGSSRVTITYQVTATFLRFITAGVAVVNVANPLIESNTVFEPTITYILILSIVIVLSIILGDMVPEAVGSGHATSLSLWVVIPFNWLIKLMSPLIAALLATSKILSAASGSSRLVNTVTEEEIMTLVDAGHTDGTIEEEQKDMIYSVLQLDQTRASEVMVPRIDVVAVEINRSLEDVGSMFVKSGYSRIPVYEDNIDNIKGMLYAKDLLAYWSNMNRDATKSVRELMRPAYFVPETKRADELLKELQTQKIHIAVVVDEYGGTAGLVTIENIIEEIIGDIQDEYDLNEEAEYVQLGPDEYTVDASIDLDDFNDLLDVGLPTEDSDTLGGYIFSFFGRVPKVGEVIEDNELTMRVLSVDGRRIRKVHVVRKRVEEPGTEDEAKTDEAQEITDKAS